MSRSSDITAQRFGSLTAKAPVVQSRNGTWKWQVVCDCGRSEVVFITVLNSGSKVCCKECRKKVWAAERTKHGHHDDPTYRSWRSMKARCQNENHDAYDRYGGRGITVDPAWENFEAFLADMGERPAGHTLDRENNDGPYCKDNCRWATQRSRQTIAGTIEEMQMAELEVGRTYTAKNQGRSITPQSIEVTIVWLDGENVHYRHKGESEVRQTPQTRFLEIIGVD